MRSFLPLPRTRTASFCQRMLVELMRRMVDYRYDPTGSFRGWLWRLFRFRALNLMGMARAVARFEALVEQALASIPACAGRQRLQQLIRAEALRLVPEEYLERAA